MDIRHLPNDHPDFPDCLRNIPDPPQAIYVMGDLAAVLEVPRLAVVGTRKVTPYGKLATTQLAGQAAERGISIISGLALGVDALAHKAALEAGGLTLAVLANGLDQITPSTNYWLGREILKQGGALVSEYPPGSPPFKLNFVARNRLVAGLSEAVLITEAAARSGSLHTAGFALDQNKIVLAVPGNINAPMSTGTNQLLKDRASPATCLGDITLALGMPTANALHPAGSNAAETAILELMELGFTDSSDLLRLSKLEAPQFNQTLTMLEITGRIQALGARQWGFK